MYWRLDLFWNIPNFRIHYFIILVQKLFNYKCPQIVHFYFHKYPNELKKNYLKLCIYIFINDLKLCIYIFINAPGHLWKSKLPQIVHLYFYKWPQIPKKGEGVMPLPPPLPHFHTVTTTLQHSHTTLPYSHTPTQELGNIFIYE